MAPPSVSRGLFVSTKQFPEVLEEINNELEVMSKAKEKAEKEKKGKGREEEDGDGQVPFYISF